MSEFPQSSSLASSISENSEKKSQGAEFQRQVSDIFNHQQFREQGYQIIDLLASYLERMANQKEVESVLPKYDAPDLLLQWPLHPGSVSNENLIQLFNRVINESLHLHHPRYVGHQTASPLPLAALCHAVTGLLNNAMGIFEMGPVHVIMEKRIIEWLCAKVGYDEHASGFLTSGGSLGNLTALLAARQIKAENDIWENGLQGQTHLAILVSDQAHYSAKRVMQIMGLGKQNIIPVKTNENYEIADLDSLETAYQLALKNNLKPIAVVGSACNTGPGTFDRLNVIADFCMHKNLWFHADGAHGATTILSHQYKHLLAGIERADSITWDLHKMFLMPSLATAVLFKKVEHSYQAVKQDAPYLKYNDGNENQNHSDHYDENIKRTFECTKPSLGLGLFLSLSYYGESFFENYIDYTYDLAKTFAEYLKQDESFEVLVTPQSNIICFRYLSKTIRDNNLLQATILQNINRSGRFFIVKTIFAENIYLRTTLMNPMTTLQDLIELLNSIKTMAIELEQDSRFRLEA